MHTQVIYGPPGTGKTYTLQKAVEDFGRPTLCVSFTRVAARELGERGVGATARTLHSIAYHALDLGSYAVVDKTKLAALTQVSGLPFRGGEYDDFVTAGDEYLSLISFARNTYQRIDDLTGMVTLGTAGEFVWFAEMYARWKKDNYFVDFTDMIMSAQNPNREVNLTGDWAGLVVDEAQDLTPAQWALVDRIIQENSFDRVWAAGDDDQAIFGWAGASPSGMQKFADKYNAEEVVLSQSFRIPSLVHRVAEGLIQGVEGRKEKEYAPRTEEGEVKSVYSVHNADEYDVILYRNHSIGVDLAKDLAQVGIPYVGRNVRSPMGTKQAKLAVAYLHLMHGKSLPPKIVADLNKVCFGGDISAHTRKRSHWSQVIPLYADLQQKLMIIESRFGRLDTIKPVVMSTIHQFKGKEEDSVLLVDGQNERTNQSSAMDKDEETRVFYVGVTRTKHTLGILEKDNPLGIRRYANV